MSEEPNALTPIHLQPTRSQINVHHVVAEVIDFSDMASSTSILDQVIDDISKGQPPRAWHILKLHPEHFTWPGCQWLADNDPQERPKYANKQEALRMSKMIVELAIHHLTKKLEDDGSRKLQAAITMERYETVIGAITRGILQAVDERRVHDANTLTKAFKEMSEDQLALLGVNIDRTQNVVLTGKILHGHVHQSPGAVGTGGGTPQEAYKAWGALELISAQPVPDGEPATEELTEDADL